MSLATGRSHTLFLTPEGKVLVTGHNEDGQLGLGNTRDVSTPTEIPDLPPIRMVAAGGNGSLLLTETGKVYVFGRLYGAQQFRYTGSNSDSYTPEPLLINDVPLIKYIAVGDADYFLVTDDNTIYIFGSTVFQTANLQTIHTNVLSINAKIITFPHNISQIIGGLYHIFILTEQGDIYVPGQYANYRFFVLQSGIQKIEGLPPIKQMSGTTKTVLLTQDGNILVKGNQVDRYNFTSLDVGFPIEKLASEYAYGESSILMIDQQQNVYVYGSNNRGQLGLENLQLVETPTKNFLSNIVDIQAAHDHSFAINSAGEVYAFGSSTYGQLGFPSRGDVYVPTKVSNIRVATSIQEPVEILGQQKTFTVSYPVIVVMINQGQFLYPSGGEGVEYQDESDHIYSSSVVNYNEQTQELTPPEYSDNNEYYGILERLIESDLLTDFGFRDDIPFEGALKAFEFADENRNRYLIQVEEHGGQIFKPL